MTEERSGVADKQAIAELLYLYCRAMDRMDIPLGYSIWHEDGEADYGEGLYRGSGRGFVDFAAASHAPMLAHSHQVTTIIINLDGDQAASESYVTAVLRFTEDGRLKNITALGRYLDRWSRREDRWAIDHRHTVMEMDEITEVTPMKRHDTARRDRSDPSYTVLKG